MKVALLGNMNNNHFSLMRYLRDLGIDASLLLYSSDGKGNNSHFKPESDTWNIDKWAPFIVHTDLPNGGVKAFKYLFNSGYLKKLLNSYDIIIGNGFAPAYCYFINRNLDIFLPYALGGEFLYYSKTIKLKALIRNQVHKYFQIAGLRQTKLICTIDNGWNNVKYFSKNKLRINQLGIPMVYYESIPIQDLIPHEIRQYSYLIDNTGFSVFSHVSHTWKNFPSNHFDIKKNHYLIQGFALFLDRNRVKDCKLFLLEYGNDIIESKKLIRELGLNEHVIWLPKMTRKEIIYLIGRVDIGCSELGGVIWGGTGWEFLCMGVPMIHYLDLSKKNYDDINLPPFFNVQTPEDIGNILENAYSNRSGLKKMGESCKQWYHDNNGTALANRYKEIIDGIFEGRRIRGVNYNIEFNASN